LTHTTVSEETHDSEYSTTLLVEHFDNINKYRRTLKTYLTALEREYVLRRLREEEEAFLETVQRAVQHDCSSMRIGPEQLEAA
jgi:hypothetical protein